MKFSLPLVLIALSSASLLCQIASAISDEDLIHFHSRILSSEQMEDLERQLQRRNGNWFGNVFNRWRGRGNGGGGGRGGGGGGDGRGRGRGRGNGGGGGGYGNGGGGGNGLTVTERDTIHGLIDNRQSMVREVDNVKDATGSVIGITAKTTSENEDVADLIQAHVRQMNELVLDGRVARQRDPLYRNLFDHMEDIESSIDYIDGEGVEVTYVADSEDECAIGLIEEHARTITKFIEVGQEEVTNTHPVPAAC